VKKLWAAFFIIEKRQKNALFSTNIFCNSLPAFFLVWKENFGYKKSVTNYHFKGGVL